MSSERVWDVHAPNVEPRECKYCGLIFYPEKPQFLYCPEHRESKYVMRVRHRERLPAPRKMITRTCFSCKQKFTFKSGKGTGTRATCDACREAKNIGHSAVIFAQNEGMSMFDPDREMALKATTWDSEYARIEGEFLVEEQDVLQYLEANEIVYGRSITEHHQSLRVLDRLELAIERVNPKKVEEMRFWARHALREHKPQQTVESVWSEPARSAKEQWVINFINKKRSGW
jgi:hypothetical protein